jgi:hypothetical protein
MQFLITSEELKKLEREASIDAVNRAIGAQSEDIQKLINQGLVAINAALFKLGANGLADFDVFEQGEVIDHVVRALLERRCKVAGFHLTWNTVEVGGKMITTNTARITHCN